MSIEYESFRMECCVRLVISSMVYPDAIGRELESKRECFSVTCVLFSGHTSLFRITVNEGMRDVPGKCVSSSDSG